MRRKHINASLHNRFTVVGTMVLAPHIFLAIVRRSHGGSLVDQFPISDSITMLLPRTIFSRTSIISHFIFSLLLEVGRQCNYDCILFNLFLVPFISRLVVGVQVGGIGDDFSNINDGRIIYPSTLLALDVGAKIFVFCQCKTIEYKGEENLIVGIYTILANSINSILLLFHRGQ